MPIIGGGRFECRYYGPQLSQIADPTPINKAMRRMADTGGDRLHAAIAEFTPVRTGNLATSWYRLPPRQRYTATGAWESMVATDVSYAPYVNYGTGLYGPEHRKYLIEPHPPNQLLSWIDPHTGKRMYARRVWHPGSKGEHMVEKGAALVEGLLQEIMFRDLEQWKADAEIQVLEAMRGVVIPKL